jgi:hypothetical protein
MRYDHHASFIWRVRMLQTKLLGSFRPESRALPPRSFARPLRGLLGHGSLRVLTEAWSTHVVAIRADDLSFKQLVKLGTGLLTATLHSDELLS